MSEKSKIQWTEFTASPWHLCSKVSEGCKNCYAWLLMITRLWPIVRKAWKAAFDRGDKSFADWETREVWGDNAPRVLAKGFWEKALALDRKAAREGVRYKMFPSMIDWLDHMPAGIIDQDGRWLDKNKVLADFLELIRLTTNIDWLLLTKRPENFPDRLLEAMGTFPEEWDTECAIPQRDFVQDWWNGTEPPANVWLGVTAENQEQADKRIPELLKIPAKIRFVSYEPALGPVDFEDIVTGAIDKPGGEQHLNCLSMEGLTPGDDEEYKGALINWIIVGGESGPKARPFNIEWARSTIAQCKAAAVPVFCKQLGAKPYFYPTGSGGVGKVELQLKDPKGGDMSEWSEDLRIRQFPNGGREG